MKSDFLIAITQLSAEKNLPKEVVFQAVEAALVSAYKKDKSRANQEILVKIHPSTGEVKVYASKTVVQEPVDANREISLSKAQKLKSNAQLGEAIELEIAPRNAGRIAAQTAKQVVLQRLREAERDIAFEEYVDKEGEIISGVVQRIEPRQIIIELGKSEAILAPAEQVRTERYRVGQRLKLYLLEVRRTNKGPQIAVSRSHSNLLWRLFELEVPEIYEGNVELKSIAREAGYRSKVAVAARQEGLDPVGSCVGLRGVRIQNIVNELSGERIDVVQWHPDPHVYIANALSPAQVISVKINNEEMMATVVVPDRQLSLAIGREGQNVRLAAKLTGWKIDIKSASAAEEEKAKEEEAAAEKPMALVEEAAPTVSEEFAELPALEISEQEQAKPAPLVEVETPVFFEPEIPPERVQIRFAEEVLAPKAAKPDTKAKKGKKKKVLSVEDREKPKATLKRKKGRRSEIPPLEEDYEEYDH